MSYRIQMIESFYPHSKSEPAEAGRVPTVDLLVDEIDVPTFLESVAIATRMARDRREQHQEAERAAAAERAARVPRGVARLIEPGDQGRSVDVPITPSDPDLAGVVRG